MHKTILDLGNINKILKLKFNLMIDDDQFFKQAVSKQDTRTIQSFMMGGSEYLKLYPHPYVSIDISRSSDKGDSWNSNLVANLSRASIYIMQKKLKIMLDGFRIQNLFYKQNGRLLLNQDVAKSRAQIVKTSNKAIAIVYAVVPDDDNKEIEYEGISLMINSLDNFCYLTYEELEYFIRVLENINLNSLALQAIQIYYLELISRSILNKTSETKSWSFSEKKYDIPETPAYAKIEEPCEIPKI